MIFFTFSCFSCSASLVELFHHPLAHLCAKRGALDPSNNRNRHLGILGEAGALNHHAPQEVLVYEHFSSLNLIFVGNIFK